MNLVMFLFMLGSVNTEYPTETLVDNIIDKFEKLSDTSLNVLVKMKLIKEITASFLSLAHPLGALLANSLDIVNKTSSEEYKAIERLHQSVTYQFDRLGERLTYSFTKEQAEQEVGAFETFITVRLNLLAFHIKHMTNVKVRKSQYDVDDFVQYCRGDNGLEPMAQYILTKVTTHCELNNTFVFVKEKLLWMDIEKKFSVAEWPSHELHLKGRIIGISEILRSLPSNYSLFELDQIRSRLTEFQTLDESLHGIHRLLRKYLPINDQKCLLDKVIEANLYDHVKISYFTSIIQIELARLLLSTDVCVDWMYPNNKPKADQMLTNMTEIVTSISKFVQEYIPKKLNASSSVEEIIAKTTIQRFSPGTSDIPTEQYYMVAHNIYRNLKHIGLETMARQILVTQTPQREWSSYFYCPRYWCSVVRSQRGMDVVISRFEKRFIYMNWSLFERSESLKKLMMTILSNDYWKDLTILTSEFDEHNITMIDAQWGRTATIVRNKTPAGVECRYTSSANEYRMEGDDLSGVAHFKYNNYPDKGWFDDNTCFDFFFFL